MRLSTAFPSFQELLRQAGAVLWLEPDYQLTSAPDPLRVVALALKEGLAAPWSPEPQPTSALTHVGMFEYLRASREAFFFHRMVDPSVMLLYDSPQVRGLPLHSNGVELSRGYRKGWCAEESYYGAFRVSPLFCASQNANSLSSCSGLYVGQNKFPSEGFILTHIFQWDKKSIRESHAYWVLGFRETSKVNNLPEWKEQNSKGCGTPICLVPSESSIGKLTSCGVLSLQAYLAQMNEVR